ncbi:hypothetical protein ACX1C1_06450 [Paenibacillus sp. strain BS8-2]
MDQKFREKFTSETEYPESWKDDIWGNLEARLDLGKSRHDESADNRSRLYNKKKHSWTKGMKIAVGSAAAVVAITVFLTLPVGTAMMDSIQHWFQPEKKIEIEVEGQKEETNGQAHVDQSSDYAIYFDKDRYKLVEGADRDMITTIDPLPAEYPEVSLTIEQKTEMLPEQLAKELAEELKGDYARVDAVERVTAPVDGYLVHAIDGNDRLSKVVNVYVVSNGKQGSFILSSNYFLEAAEGHGSRFRQTLEQFQVLEEE